MKRGIKRMLTILIVMFLAVFMTGCQQSNYIENHAYALFMGMDMDDDGVWRLTVRIPRISSGGSGAGNGGGNQESEYLTFSSVGKDFNEALMMLEAGMPRTLNLSGMTLIAVSDKIAASRDMYDLILQLADNYSIYGSTRMAICEGNAGQFVEQQETVIGTSLSEGIASRLQNSARLGYILQSRLADIFYDTVSIYSDPMAVLCTLAQNEDSMAPGDTSVQRLSVKSESKNRYMGAAVMRDGIMVGKLTGMQTIFVNILKGDVDGFSYTMDGISIQMAGLSKPAISIDTGAGAPSIDILLKFSAMGTPESQDIEKLTDELTEKFMETLSVCQQMGAEPFGFAELAASDFFTIASWQSYNWREAFSIAEINLKIDITDIE